MLFLGLLIPFAYWPGVDGWTINTGWPVLSICLPFFFIKKVQMTSAHWLGLIFLAYATLGLLWTPVWQQGIWDLWVLGILACAFLLGASDRDLSRLYLGLGVGVSVSTIVSAFQWYGYHPVSTVSDYAPAGLFFNFDVFGEVAAVVTIALIVSEHYWPLILTVPPIFFTHSRTAILAIICALALWLWDIYRWQSAYILAPVLAIIGALAYHHGLDGSEALRLSMWQDTLSGLTPFGHGPGSFFISFPLYALHSDTMALRPEAPHNEFLYFAFQYGIGFTPLLILLAAATFSPKRERYILAAFAPLLLFGFPSVVPTEGFLLAVVLGRLCLSWNLHGLHGYYGRLHDCLWQSRPSSPALPMEQIHPYSTGL